MKCTKKLLGLLLAVSLLACTTVFAENETSNTLTATEELLQYEILTDDAEENSVDMVTRSELTVMICRLLSFSKTAEATVVTQAVFSDVTPEYPVAGYIATAKSMGIICGYPDGSFAPDTAVTYPEALKMLIAALGYLPKAEQMGGYPHGMVMVANQIGLTDGMVFQNDMPAKRSDIIHLFRQALDIPLMEQTGWGKDAIYDVNAEKTLRKNLEEALTVIPE